MRKRRSSTKILSLLESLIRLPHLKHVADWLAAISILKSTPFLPNSTPSVLIIFNYHYIFRVDYTNVCHLRLQLCI